MSDVEMSMRWRVEAVHFAEAVVSGRIGPVEGARELTAIGYRLVDELSADSDFAVLLSVQSETDDLPAGQARAHWDPAALALKDRELADYELRVRDAVLAACRSIRSRYAAG